MQLAPALALLGLRAGGFDLEQLREAFRREALRLHPDHGGSDSEFHELRKALALLKKFLKENTGASDRHDELREQARRTAAAQAASAAGERPGFNPAAFNRAFQKEHMERPVGHGEWLSADIPEDRVCPSKVAFKQFNDAFSAMAKKNSLSLIVRTQLVMPAANCTLAPGGMGGDERSDDYSSSLNSKVPYTDLRMAHDQQIIDSAEAVEFARKKAAALAERLKSSPAKPRRNRTVKKAAAAVALPETSAAPGI